MPGIYQAIPIVLDTNVYLSAILCGGNPAEYFALANRNMIKIYYSDFIETELTTLLKRKFSWKPSELSRLVSWLASIATKIIVNSEFDVVKRKPSDNLILACAYDAHAKYLITGDKKDLLPLKNFKGIKILSPIEGLAILA